MNEPLLFRYAVTTFALLFWYGLSFLFAPGGSAVFEWVRCRTLGEITAMFGLVVASAVPIGFLLSSVTIFWLRGGFLLVARRHYESAELGSDEPYRTATLAHIGTPTAEGYSRPEGLSAWIARRWGAFLSSANCAVAVAFATGIAACEQRATGCYWALSVLAVLILLANAADAWIENMAMLRYHHRMQPPAPPTAASG